MKQKLTFDPDGGDLGRAEFVVQTATEFQLVIPHIASIFESIHQEGWSRLPVRYGLEFPVRLKNEIELLIPTIELPPHVDFFEVDGRRCFEIRGASGGVATSMICYVVTAWRG